MQSDDDIRDKSFRILEAVSPLDVSPGSARRRWSVAARERIIREAMAPGANVSAVARAHGLKPQQVFGWRRRAMAEGGMISRPAGHGEPEQSHCAAGTPMPFVELALGESEDEGAIELIVGRDVTIRVGPGVSMGRLQMVLRAVRSA